MFEENENYDRITHPDERPEQTNGDEDEHGRTFQFLPCRPRAFFQFLPCFLNVSGELADLSLPPEVGEDSPDHQHPNCNCQITHKYSLTTLSGLPSRNSQRLSLVRMPVFSRFAGFGTAIPPCGTGGEGGIRTPVGLSPKAVFKTAAIDHSATSPLRRLARQEGLEPPTNGFGDRYSTN